VFRALYSLLAMARRGRGGKKRSTAARRPVLADHQAVGKKRIPPLTRFPLAELTWHVEVLPDFLWIAYTLGRRSEWWAVRRALDVIDQFVPEDGDVVDGRLSAFDFVPPENRSSVRAALEVEAPGAFPSAFGHAIGLFPDCGAIWLYEDWLQRHTPDPTVGLRCFAASSRKSR